MANTVKETGQPAVAFRTDFKARSPQHTWGILLDDAHIAGSCGWLSMSPEQFSPSFSASMDIAERQSLLSERRPLTQTNETALGRLLIGVGFIGLGALCLLYRGSLGGWMPIPEWLPAKALFATTMGAILVAAGGAALKGRYSPHGAFALAAVMVAWTLILHPWTLVVARFGLGAWLGVAELAAMASALWILGMMLAHGADGTQLRGMRLALLVFALSLPVFGLCHFVYLEFTAGMIPSWMPWRTFWAFATGVAHVAAGVALLTNIQARLVATLLGIMFGLSTVLVHVPRIAMNPDDRMAWTLLFTSTVLTGAVWIIAGFVRASETGSVASERALRSEATT